MVRSRRIWTSVAPSCASRLIYRSTKVARVAQLDRASASGAEGHRFESRRAHCPPFPLAGSNPCGHPSRRMPRVEHWSQLRIGLIVLAGIIAAVAAVMLFARIGALHGKTTRLYLVTDMASGVLNGTEVWLAGTKIGLVRSVELRPPATDTAERVAIAMDVLDPYVRYIRRNSDVRIQPGGRLIGSPVVYIEVGICGGSRSQRWRDASRPRKLQARSGLAERLRLATALPESQPLHPRSNVSLTRPRMICPDWLDVIAPGKRYVALDNFRDRARRRAARSPALCGIARGFARKRHA